MGGRGGSSPSYITTSPTLFPTISKYINATFKYSKNIYEGHFLPIALSTSIIKIPGCVCFDTFFIFTHKPLDWLFCRVMGGGGLCSFYPIE